jgi:hypothetical protein
MPLSGLSTLHIIAPQTPKALRVAQIVEGCPVVTEAVGAHALLPGRLAKVNLVSRELTVMVLLQVVEVQIAPPRLIGDIGQEATIRRKSRLEDANGRAAGQGVNVGKIGQPMTISAHGAHL